MLENCFRNCALRLDFNVHWISCIIWEKLVYKVSKVVLFVRTRVLLVCSEFCIVISYSYLPFTSERERERERERHLVSTLLVEWYKYRSRNALKESRKKDEINKKDIAMTDVADKSIIHDFSLILRNLINLIRIQIKSNPNVPTFPYRMKVQFV